ASMATTAASPLPLHLLLHPSQYFSSGALQPLARPLLPPPTLAGPDVRPLFPPLASAFAGPNEPLPPPHLPRPHPPPLLPPLPPPRPSSPCPPPPAPPSPPPRPPRAPPLSPPPLRLRWSRRTTPSSPRPRWS